MATARPWGDQAIRWTTTLSVVVLAGIAAVLSYKHMYVLVRRYGETTWTAALLPVSVDGMIVASSMTLLADSRRGRRSGLLPWSLLVIGSVASLAANMAVAEPSLVGRLIAAWPSAALIGSYELLMRQVRCASRGVAHIPAASSSSRADEVVSVESSGDTTTVSSAARTRMTGDRATSHQSHPTQIPARADAGGVYADGAAESMLPNVGADAGGIKRTLDADAGPRLSASGLQRQAWVWATANRTPDGALPSGKTIAERFGRRERWGRLVKQAGLTGRLDSAAARS